MAFLPIDIDVNLFEEHKRQILSNEKNYIQLNVKSVEEDVQSLKGFLNFLSQHLNKPNVGKHFQ